MINQIQYFFLREWRTIDPLMIEAMKTYDAIIKELSKKGGE